jgi:hypothetical protein
MFLEDLLRITILFMSILMGAGSFAVESSPSHTALNKKVAA